MNRCSICKTLIQPSDPIAQCPECQSVYHRECWRQLGGCATYGCRAAPLPEALPLPTSVRGGWGDEKVCPQCSRNIPSSLIVCQCGARFPWADPMTRQEYEAWVVEDLRRGRARKEMVLLFVLNLVGFLAVVAGPAAGILAYRSRKVLAGGSGAYLALGYGATVIGLFYILIFLLLYLGM